MPAMADPGVWRSFHNEFETLAADEFAALQGKGEGHWLVASVVYAKVSAEVGQWDVYGHSNEQLRTRFDLLSTRAGVALGSPPGEEPIEYWLRGLFLDLLKHKSKYLRFAARTDDNGIIERVCTASALFCARLEKQAMETGRPSVVALNPLQSAKKTLPQPPGRPVRLSSQFTALASSLWSQKRGSGRAKVTAEQLCEIARALDANNYVPPAEYLEAKYAVEVRKYNSRSSNSKAGPIKSWSQLVSIGDKDHIRGMRRLLSRCAARSS